MDRNKTHTIEQIATMHSDFKEKFGIPRQSGIVPGLRSRIEFEEGYRNADALRGLEGFSHIWLIWGFSENDSWSPLVRPPRLGGKTKVGVWASRSPFRPNGLGMSVVKVIEVNTDDPKNPYIIVGGSDLLDGTPIYDIKSYAYYSDAIPDAVSGFAVPDAKFVDVEDPCNYLAVFDEPDACMSIGREAVIGVLEQDPRAAYDKKPGYEFGMRFGAYDVKFTYSDDGKLTVIGVVKV